MLAMVVAVLGLLVAVVLDMQVQNNVDLAASYQARTNAYQVASVAEAVENYYIEKSAYPATLDALQATAGYEYLSSRRNNWQGYAVSGTLSDTAWNYKRAVVYLNNPTSGDTAATYLGNNTCGTGDATTAASWCGSGKSQWFRSESRQKANPEIMTQRLRMRGMQQKLADYFSDQGFFPGKDALGVALAANSMTRLKTLAGYAGTAGSCSGVFQWQGIPIDCSDMFDKWGGDVGYQYLDQRHIILVSETPYYNSSGTKVIIGADFQI